MPLIIHYSPQAARTCVNGGEITERVKLCNGDRLLWGSNHFFRVNCPKGVANSEPTPTTPFDWRMAQEEVMMAEMDNVPMREAMAKLERQYEVDKQTALENQRREYEKQFQQLKSFMSPSTPYAPFVPADPLRPHGKMTTPLGTSASTMSRLEQKWDKQRDDTFKRGLAKLREDIVRANVLVREANFLSKEMGREIKFSVTLQIPAHNLTPNRRRGVLCEPAILVKRGDRGSIVWPLEKLDFKLIDMREVYEDVKSNKNLSFQDVGRCFPDPFSESGENHNLIGVANIFLDVLFHDVKLDYQTPIISQHGEVSGRLHVEIERISGSLQCGDKFCRDQAPGTGDSCSGDSVTCRLSIKSATGLPPSLSQFVFCQYTFWGDSEVSVSGGKHFNNNLVQKC